MVRLAHTRPDILHATKPNFLLTWDASWTLSCTPVLVGLSIVSSWTTLLVAGRWRPEASWIDRLGRVVAMGWLLAGLFTTCHQLVHRFLDTASSVIVWE
jgi:hypothetical protein